MKEGKKDVQLNHSVLLQNAEEGGGGLVSSPPPEAYAFLPISAPLSTHPDSISDHLYPKTAFSAAPNTTPAKGNISSLRCSGLVFYTAGHETTQIVSVQRLCAGIWKQVVEKMLLRVAF